LLIKEKNLFFIEKKVQLALSIIVLMVLASSPLFAQSCNPNVPIDGGLSALLVAGAGYGIKKINEKKKEK
jgi:hypothetical protein